MADKINPLRIHQLPELYDALHRKAPRYTHGSLFPARLKKAWQITGLAFDRNAKSMYNFRFSGFCSNLSLLDPKRKVL
jgi:hypothetical protein